MPCRAGTCATMRLSFTCGELSSLLSCSCGGCCEEYLPVANTSTNLTTATANWTADTSRTCIKFPPALFPIGVVMGVFGSIGINVGQNLQADGIQQLPGEQRESEQWRSPKWRLGMALFISFSILNFVALAFAPASVLVPLESIQFVTNVAYSSLVHKKTVPRRMGAGVGLACLGTVFTVVFGAPGGGCHSIAVLESSWATGSWWFYVGMSLAIALVSLRVHVVYDRQLKLGVKPPPRHHEYVQPITFTLTAALVGGSQMIVQSKVFSELLAMIFQGDLMVFTSWIFCALIFATRLLLLLARLFACRLNPHSTKPLCPPPS